MVANSFPHIDLNSTEDAPVDVPFDRNAHEASHVQAAHASAPDRDAAQGLTAVIKSVKELLTTPATVPVTGVNSGSNGASSRLLSPNGGVYTDKQYLAKSETRGQNGCVYQNSDDFVLALQSR